MAVDRTYIVCFGMDRHLLETRQLLLERAGYLTLLTSDAHLARASLRHLNVGIVVLCHTLPSEEIVSMIRFHHDMLSTASMLCLKTAGTKCPLPFGDVFDTREGPVAFLSTICKLGHTHRQLMDRQNSFQ